MARPKASDYDEKRQAILGAAAALFAERGFGGTSMSMIAEDAGGSKAWLYHYYESKEAIAEDLVFDFLTNLGPAHPGSGYTGWSRRSCESAPPRQAGPRCSISPRRSPAREASG
jgi:hypothetical protein